MLGIFCLFESYSLIIFSYFVLFLDDMTILFIWKLQILIDPYL